MKKPLADIKVSTSSEEAPKHEEKRFGAFKTVNGNQAVIDLDILRQYNVFFATPCYGGSLTDQYFLSMIRTLQTFIKHGINFRITTLRNESLIPRARNILTAMFLDSGCSHLLFIDADIEFQPDDVLRALAYDKPIMAGAYPKKTLPIQYAINFKFQDTETKQIRVENGAVELLDASTGFFLIKREVIEKMMEAYPELHYRNDSNISQELHKYCYALFDTMIDPADNRYLSEDYAFARRWQAIGGEIWLDPNTKLNHVGSYTFEGDVSKIISSK
jgi:glycosyltransferase involved in cell wall biosynthesis